MDNRKRASVMVGITVLLALAFLPGLVITWVGYPVLTSVATLAALGTLIPALMTPRWIAAMTVVAIIVLSGLAAPASTTPWLAALVLACTGALVGAASTQDASGPLVVAAIGIIFLIAEPPPLADVGWGPAATLMIATGAAAVWGLAAGLFIRSRRSLHPREPDPSSRARAGAYAGTLAVVLGVSGWFVVHLDLGHGGAWFLMTFVIILQPYLQDAWRLTVERAIGTVGGVLLAMVLYAVLQDFPVILYALAAIAAVTALTIRTTTTRPYWQYVVALTPGVVLLEGLGRSVVDTAESRVGFTLLAAGIALGIEAAARPIYRRRSQRAGATRY